MSIPLIVISSSRPCTGKTTLALNLATALAQDGYQVGIFTDKAEDFIKKRRALSKSKHLPPLHLIAKEELLAQNFADCTAVIAEVPSQANDEFLPVFSKSHTLITVAENADDINWSPTDAYLNLIWQAKKNLASVGIKYLNWIVVKNRVCDDEVDEKLIKASNRYGFRFAPTLEERAPFTYVENGYGVADLQNFSGVKMTMSDMYARRELLLLAEFVWQKDYTRK